jgi:hypothetical protein
MTVWQPEGWLDGAQQLASPNFGERPPGEAVSLVVLHNISLPPDEFTGKWVEDFFLNRLDAAAHPYFATIAGVQVSAHFYIRRDGRVIQRYPHFLRIQCRKFVFFHRDPDRFQYFFSLVGQFHGPSPFLASFFLKIERNFLKYSGSRGFL